MDVSHLIASSSYPAIFFLMVLNGVLNFPSSQLLYIVAGYFISTSSLHFVPTVIVGALGNTLGNIITFLLVKKYEKPFAKKILMMDDTTFTKIHGALHDTFSKNGMWYIFFGKLIPSVKAFIPVVAGLANTKTRDTSLLFLISSTIWATVITSIGYYFGKNVSLTSFTFISLAIGGSILYIVYRNVTRRLS
jgi:membrane protein DedA with SNARE-associated domain